MKTVGGSGVVGEPRIWALRKSSAGTKVNPAGSGGVTEYSGELSTASVVNVTVRGSPAATTIDDGDAARLPTASAGVKTAPGTRDNATPARAAHAARARHDGHPGRSRVVSIGIPFVGNLRPNLRN